MKKTLRILLAGTALSLGLVGTANAIQLDNIPINAVIVPPVEMAHRQVMNFGSYAAGTATSTITIANLTAANLTAFTGLATITTTRTSAPLSGVGGAAILVGGTTGTASIFSVGGGYASASIASITLPATAVTLAGCGTGVTVDTFTRFPAAALAASATPTAAVINSNVTLGAAVGAVNVAVTNPDPLGNTDVALGRFEARMSVAARLNLPASGTTAGVCQGVYSLTVNY
jgi:hypothetical protein